jgi:hypothetical protein
VPEIDSDTDDVGVEGAVCESEFVCDGVCVVVADGVAVWELVIVGVVDGVEVGDVVCVIEFDGDEPADTDGVCVAVYVVVDVGEFVRDVDFVTDTVGEFEPANRVGEPVAESAPGDGVAEGDDDGAEMARTTLFEESARYITPLQPMSSPDGEAKSAESTGPFKLPDVKPSAPPPAKTSTLAVPVATYRIALLP